MEEKFIIKPITLTSEQREELITLCNKTWPDLKWHFWDRSFITTDEEGEEDTNNIGFCNTSVIKGMEISTYLALEINWFEFVVRMAIEEERDEFLNFYLNVCDN